VRPRSKAAHHCGVAGRRLLGRARGGRVRSTGHTGGVCHEQPVSWHEHLHVQLDSRLPEWLGVGHDQHGFTPRPDLTPRQSLWCDI
jgi:hypothetical protein